MKSMTGYAAIECENDEIKLSIEIRGCNNRYLEVSVSMPQTLSPYEREIRRLVGEYCRRGKIEISIRAREKCGFSAKLNYAALETHIELCVEAEKRVNGRLRISEAVNIFDLLRCDGVLESEKEPMRDDAWQWVKPLLAGALESFDAERNREGARTAETVFNYVADIEEACKTIESFLPKIEGQIKATITRRFEELGGGDLDENRILAETAMLLMKWTIAEEVSRIKSHLVEFRAEMERGGVIGKKLDFLCQEIAREVNTIGSKTPLVEVSRLVVLLKEALENIREQLRNVE
ncbi:MAG: YicC family protein [Spirochaetaceae bacterium]|jgi:uncharacterized protein (TIGR00255 family)|nr:YicC family protein [Spirochaetaceae bacterium]